MSSVIGYRKFVMTVILIASLLVWLGVIPAASYTDLLKWTVGLYMGGVAFTRMADKQGGGKPS